MTGMGFLPFLTLLVIGLVVAVLFDFVFHYRFLEGWDAFLGRAGWGWLGGWLGSPVLGHWGFQVDNVYIIPALLGAISAVGASALFWKAVAKACGTRVGA